MYPSVLSQDREVSNVRISGTVPPTFIKKNNRLERSSNTLIFDQSSSNQRALLITFIYDPLQKSICLPLVLTFQTIVEEMLLFLLSNTKEILY